MAKSAGFRVEGVRNLVKELQAMGVEVEDLKEAFGDLASEGARKAAGFVKSRTGRLAASVRGNRAKNKAVVTAGRASVPYGGVTNYGWSKRNITGQQFMQRADEAMRPVAIERITDHLQKTIKRRGL
jgi:phage gpG-like protein